MTTAHPIPKGFRSVTPYLFAARAAELIDFMKSAFGAEEELRLHRDDGSIMHAVIRIDGSAVMVGDATGPAVDIGPLPSSIYLYVENATTSTPVHSRRAGRRSCRSRTFRSTGNVMAV